VETKKKETKPALIGSARRCSSWPPLRRLHLAACWIGAAREKRQCGEGDSWRRFELRVLRVGHGPTDNIACAMQRSEYSTILVVSVTKNAGLQGSWDQKSCCSTLERILGHSFLPRARWLLCQFFPQKDGKGFAIDLLEEEN